MSQITTHVLDTGRGKPAEGIQIFLYVQEGNDWLPVANGTTDKDGRILHLMPDTQSLHGGVYKMEFLTSHYFTRLEQKTFYPVIPIVFEIASSEHYHIPLLLNPFGYTTYRGS